MPKNHWQQQIHSGCGGEIVVVVRDRKELSACCKKCRFLWLIPAELAVFPQWKTPNDLRTSSGLHIARKVPVL